MTGKRVFFEPVDIKQDFSQMEKRLLKNWYEMGIAKKYLAKNKSSKKIFSFLDGPITANNPMGVHHAWGRTYKDLWQRYKNMRGFRQRFQNGFDCQGLWVEVEVEKELGLKGKKDIENLVFGDKNASIAKFVDLCKKRVIEYSGIQTEQSKRLGYFMDWDNSYFTMSDENNYMIWHFLKRCYDMGLIYKGRDSVPWCPRCGTAISQHEMLTEDYKEAVHKSIYFKLGIERKEGEYLLVWTTTPWTLPANVAVAVDKKLDYSLVEDQSGQKLWLAKDAIDKIFAKDRPRIVKTKKGESLVGLKYKSAFDDLERVKFAAQNPEFHKVVATDERILPISVEEGTGLVHIATGAGSEDFALGKKLGLPVIEVIDEEANYIDGLGKFSSKNAKNHPEVILDYLKKRDEMDGGIWVFDIHTYKHRYPTCWRCKSELVWRVVDEWYISIDSIRDDMKKVAKKINWIPKFGLKRELDWLSNMHDWLISKKRYWGLALPIWECTNCGHFEVIGSKEELRQRAVDGWEKFEGHSPHRPWVDEVEINCQKCRQRIKRIPDVGNPWLDAGIVSFSTISRDNKGEPLYKRDKREWRKWFPADFITESFPGQFKNWFYSLIAMSTVLEKAAPFKNVLGFATLLAEDGRPMHKSWGNSIEFNEGADKIGVDVMRWMYLRQNPSENLLFGYRVAYETRRRFHLKLWNIYNFFVIHANKDGWKPAGTLLKAQPPKSTSVLDRWIVSRLVETLDRTSLALDSFDAFVATAYLEEFVDDFSNWYVRRGRERAGEEIFYQTYYFVLVNLTRLLAPFIPFIADEMYVNLTKQKSVHLADWPEVKAEVDKKLILDMENLRKVVENAHSVRKQKQIPIRQPLSLLRTTVPFEVPPQSMHFLILSELNVKKWIVKKGSNLSNKFDTRLSPYLKEEAQTRELIRKVQKQRKLMGISLTQMIDLANPWFPKSPDLIKTLKQKTFARSLKKGDFKVLKAS